MLIRYPLHCKGQWKNLGLASDGSNQQALVLKRLQLNQCSWQPVTFVKTKCTDNITSDIKAYCPSSHSCIFFSPNSFMHVNIVYVKYCIGSSKAVVAPWRYYLCMYNYTGKMVKVIFFNQTPSCICFFCCLIWFLMSNQRPINNLSVKEGRVFLGWTSTKLG